MQKDVNVIITEDEVNVLLDYFYSIYTFSEATELTFRIPNDDSEVVTKMRILGEKLNCVKAIKKIKNNIEEN